MGTSGWTLSRSLSEVEAVLWAVVVLASVFDVVTTIVGLARGASEANAVAAAFLHTYGTPGVGLLKFSALVVVVLAWWRSEGERGVAILLAFALVSMAVVALNALTLVST